MKLNKYKMGLVVVVMMIMALPLIVSGCGAPAGNQTPDFLRVGGSYDARCSGGDFHTFRVVEIRRDGWILIDIDGRPGYYRYRWLNPTQLVWIEERERP